MKLQCTHMDMDITLKKNVILILRIRIIIASVGNTMNDGIQVQGVNV